MATAGKKERYLQRLQQDEAFHASVYRLLSKLSVNSRFKKEIEELSKLEAYHSLLLSNLLHKMGYKKPKEDKKLARLITFASIKILGLPFAIKLMEYNKLLLNKRLKKAMQALNFSKPEKDTLRKLAKGEESEDKLTNRLLQSNHILKNVHDVVFGMNDGLVEVLAATVGFASALQVPSLILIASLLVALSGALSMAGGAYISTKYENKLSATKNAHIPLRSAFYTGLFYIFGAAVPILPFAIGISGTIAIILAIAATAVIVIITSAVIAVLNNDSIPKRVAEALLISIGAASVAIMLGTYARMALHISI